MRLLLPLRAAIAPLSEPDLRKVAPTVEAEFAQELRERGAGETFQPVGPGGAAAA